MKLENNDKLYKFYNCSLLRRHTIVEEDLWVRNGKIINPEKIFFDEQSYADVEINCYGALVCPGFIDLQINGRCRNGLLYIPFALMLLFIRF